MRIRQNQKSEGERAAIASHQDQCEENGVVRLLRFDLNFPVEIIDIELYS